MFDHNSVWYVRTKYKDNADPTQQIDIAKILKSFEEDTLVEEWMEHLTDKMNMPNCTIDQISRYQCKPP